MPKGKSCPICEKNSLHEKDGYYECSNCKFIGWALCSSVENVRRGKGVKCPNCSKQTLHSIKVVEEFNVTIRRCSKCYYVGIEFNRD